MSRMIFCALIAFVASVAGLCGEANAGGGAIQTQGAPFKSKGLSLAPRVVPLSEVSPFTPPRYYPQYYARTSLRLSRP